jgi:hypothetical protein
MSDYLRICNTKILAPLSEIVELRLPRLYPTEKQIRLSKAKESRPLLNLLTRLSLNYIAVECLLLKNL